MSVNDKFKNCGTDFDGRIVTFLKMIVAVKDVAENHADWELYYTLLPVTKRE